MVRGFTVVCLAVALVGMVVAILVADASRPQRRPVNSVSCMLEHRTSCFR